MHKNSLLHPFATKTSWVGPGNPPFPFKQSPPSKTSRRPDSKRRPVVWNQEQSPHGETGLLVQQLLSMSFHHVSKQREMSETIFQEINLWFHSHDWKESYFGDFGVSRCVLNKSFGSSWNIFAAGSGALLYSLMAKSQSWFLKASLPFLGHKKETI